MEPSGRTREHAPPGASTPAQTAARRNQRRVVSKVVKGVLTIGVLAIYLVIVVAGYFLIGHAIYDLIAAVV